MKNKIIFSGILMLFVTLIFSACDDKEPYQSIHPSPRDGVYEGNNLTVTIDGETVNSIKSVRIFSEIIGYAEGSIDDDNEIIDDESNPIYHTWIIFSGFPGTNEELSLKTVSTLYFFDGKFKIRLNDRVLFYEYNGAFTGNPELPHSEQGLILEFSTIEN